MLSFVGALGPSQAQLSLPGQGWMKVILSAPRDRISRYQPALRGYVDLLRKGQMRCRSQVPTLCGHLRSGLHDHVDTDSQDWPGTACQLVVNQSYTHKQVRPSANPGGTPMASGWQRLYLTQLCGWRRKEEQGCHSS